MNYRHIYHAGNACDISKHAALTLLIKRMAAKEKPFAVIDTHAGAGRYDLRDARAAKTGEAEEGFAKLARSGVIIPEIREYHGVIGGGNVATERGFYPGSPLLIRSMLRPCDRLIACELHPDDAASLFGLFHGDNMVQIHRRDGYEALSALTPFPEGRGLAFLDPPYEAADEFSRLADAVAAAHRRWPVLRTAAWYPIKDRSAVWNFHEELLAKTPSSAAITIAEFVYSEEVRGDRLNGSGLALVNPPWGIEDEIAAVFVKLHEAMDSAHKGINARRLR